MKIDEPRRLLLCDDDRAIHRDYLKSLTLKHTGQELDALEAQLFGQGEARVESEASRASRLEQASPYEIVHAYSGEQALAKVTEARSLDRPFAAAFVDMRMEPGWNGVETVRRLWGVDPDLQIVICTAYADLSWGEIAHHLGRPDAYVILKKPFEPIEVRQLAAASTELWFRRHRERALLASANRLVAARSAELEAQTRRLQEELEERARIEAELSRSRSLEVLGQLVAGLGHEIKNPLAYIGSNLSFLGDVLKDPGITLPAGLRQEIDEAILDTQQGLRVIQEIVSGIRLTGPGRTTDPEPVDLHEVLNLALRVAMARLRGVAQVETRLRGTPQVLASPTRLCQVFVNLLVNAAQAMESAGDKEHLLTICSRAEANGAIAIEIQDTGCGIPEANLSKIFDPFFTTKAREAGTGLGLSLVHAFVKEMEGEMQIESQPGQGTRVRISLPRAPIAQGEPAVALKA